MNVSQNFLKIFFHLYVALFTPLVFLPHVTNYFEVLFWSCPVYKLLFTNSNIQAKNSAVRTSSQFSSFIYTIISNMWQVLLSLQNLALSFPLKAEESWKNLEELRKKISTYRWKKRSASVSIIYPHYLIRFGGLSRIPGIFIQI